jgi:adenine-specific DNA-methyltransferase
MLFNEYKYFDYKFPEPQYLGAKHKLLPWIAQHFPSDVKTAIDAFSGSQSVAFYFKQSGFKTITADFLSFSNQIGKALIENKETHLEKADVMHLFSPAPNKADFTLMEDQFSDVFFEYHEAKFLDNFRANLESLNNPFKRALAISVMNRSLTRKITMGHFAHTQALAYATNPDRIKRNRSLIRPIKEIFVEFLPHYNNAIFDNGKDNTSYSGNILDILPIIPKADLVYFDPPYCNSHADYQGFYHLLETFTEYWRDRQFINSIRRYEPQRFSGFDKKSDVLTSFEKLFEFSANIPHWILSYNDRSYPSIEDLTRIISKYRNVSLTTKTYTAGRGGKGSVAGSKEILFICSPKPALSIPSITPKEESA